MESPAVCSGLLRRLHRRWARRSGHRLSPRLVAVPALLGALTLAACSGEETLNEADPSEAAQQTPIDAAVLADEIATEFQGDHATASARREAACFADALLAEVEPEELRSAGLVGTDGHLIAPLPTLGEDIATSWVAAQQECSDFVTSSAQALFAQSKGKLDRDAYARCLRAALSEEQIRAGLIAAITGAMQSEEVTVLTEAQGTCAAQALPSD